MSRMIRAWSRLVHPRIRGEDISAWSSVPITLGSHPHARGIHKWDFQNSCYSPILLTVSKFAILVFPKMTPYELISYNFSTQPP